MGNGQALCLKVHLKEFRQLFSFKIPLWFSLLLAFSLVLCYCVVLVVIVVVVGIVVVVIGGWCDFSLGSLVRLSCCYSPCHLGRTRNSSI